MRRFTSIIVFKFVVGTPADPVGEWLPSPRGGALAKGVEALRADRDLGYRGGRQTGLAFIEETHLLPGEVVWDETVGQDNQCFWRCDSTVVGGQALRKDRPMHRLLLPVWA